MCVTSSISIDSIVFTPFSDEFTLAFRTRDKVFPADTNGKNEETREKEIMKIKDGKKSWRM